MVLRHAKRTFVAVLSLLLVVSCTHRKPPQQPEAAQFPNWPVLFNDFRFRWTADPGIDLLTGPAVPVRAYIESMSIGELTQTPSSKLYPGFERSIAAGSKDDPIKPEQVAEKYGERRQKGPFYGNDYLHFLDIRPINSGLRAYVCEGMYNVYYPAPDKPGKFYPMPSPPFVWYVELSKQGDDRHSVPQKGPLPAPVSDVFNGWHIESADALDNTWGPDLLNEMQRRCYRSMPHTSEQRAQIYQTIRDSPPKTEPAVPGWPDNQA